MANYIISVLVILFMLLFKERLTLAFTNIQSESRQEVLFILFVLVAIIIAILGFLRNYSLIPVLGVLCCAYLMIEIPTRS